MEKKMNNKGFSLVELIIVVAIMAVLIGVLAPAYLQYVEKSKKTTDCTAIGDIMNAIETIAADPAITWSDITVKIDTSGCTYTGEPTDAAGNDCLDAIVPESDVALTGTWDGGDIEFTATKGGNGIVTFTLASGGITTTEIDAISPALSKRFGGTTSTGGSTGGTTTP